MDKYVKKTRNCIEPWRSVQFEAGGNVTPCCSGTITGNFGNINTDYFDAPFQGRSADIFANTDYQNLRQGLLTGDLQPSCASCRSVHDEDVSTEELRKRVVNHLESHGVQTGGLDLTKAFAFYECGGNITNKCNFSCVYCAHSGSGGHEGYFSKEMDRERFLELIALLCSRGLKIFNFCGIGEFSVYPGWKELCDLLLQRHPQLLLRGISNFGKRFEDAELETLARFDLIHVSCDTHDEATHARLRKGGQLPLLLDNVSRLRERFSGNPFKDPKLVFNVTATDAVIDKLEDLFRFAARNDMFVHISNLFVMEGSVASQTDCVKNISRMDDSEMPRVRETLIDLPRRLKAENPLVNVWELKNLLKSVVRKADATTLNQFVPAADEPVYEAFYRSHPQCRHAYLRKIWLSFDRVLKGVFVAAGNSTDIALPYPSARLSYRAIWCRERIDGNLEITAGQPEVAAVADHFILSAENCGDCHDFMLFEVLACEPADPGAELQVALCPVVPTEGTAAKLLVREACIKEDEATVVQRVVEAQEPVVIWCAGLKTLQLLSNTRLGEASIEMIIDSDPARAGQIFCGRTIHAPEDLAGFNGTILVIHSSCPEQVEFDLRQRGITNNILVL